MNITTLQLGPFETNCYFFLYRGQGFLVDPGDAGIDPSGFERVDWILLTHGHVDHVLGLQKVKERFPAARLALCEADRNWYEKTALQASMFGLRHHPVPPPDAWLSPPCETAGIQVIPTPGHTPGSVCYFIPEENVLFSGDTLFAGGVGRTDFPGGSWSQLVQSIHWLYQNIPPAVRVYPGHGPATTIDEEMRSNPFISAK